MPSLQELIIPKVNAQSDTVAQPTFGTIDVGGDSVGVSSTVLVSSDKTSVNVGDTVTLRVEVNTKEIAINEYRIILDFDPARFTVLDQNPDVSGTQVTLLDTIFEVQNPQNENVVQNGRLTLVAKTESGNSFTVNRDVAEIKLQAQSVGSSIIKIVEGSSGTQLIRQTGFGVSFTTNEVTVGITTTPQDSNDDDLERDREGDDDDDDDGCEQHDDDDDA